MGNTLETALGALRTGLATLTTGATPVLKILTHEWMNPLTVPSAPALSVILESLSRNNDVWTATLLMCVVAHSTGTTPLDVELARVLGEIEAVLDSVAGVLESPKWDVWCSNDQSNINRLGAFGGLRLRVDAPLKTT